MVERILFGLLLSIFAACATETGPPDPSTPGERPPVILISVDTLRADRLPAYGYDGVETPAIDRLRRDAILFENAYTPTPLTLPAHASLLTGLSPAEHGVRDNLGYELPASPSLAARLREAGYRTGAAVSSYVLRRSTGLDAGFETYDDAIEATAEGQLGRLQRSGPDTVAQAEAWLARQPGATPFFFFLHLFEPHTPYEPPEPFASRYADPYDGEIAAADAAVGAFLDTLRRLGLYRRAVIVFLSDHGEGLGDHGEAEHGILLYRETLRVPLLVKLPESLRGGSTVSEAAQLEDVVPTILAVAGLPPPEGLRGRSLLELSETPPDPPRRRLYGESYYPRLHLGWSELVSLVDDRYHFIDGPEPELFDLRQDPGETRNVLEAERAVSRALRRELDGLRSELEEPEPVGAGEAAALASLGYLTRQVAAGGTLPDPRSALPVLAELEAALEAARIGEHAAAVAGLEAILEQHPRMVDARFQLGVSLVVLGREEEALAHFRRGIETAPSAAEGMLIEVAKILARQGHYDRAEEHAQAAMQRLPVEALLIRSQLALVRGEGSRAIELARQAVAAEPLPRSESMLLLGRLYLLGGELGEALRVFDELRAREAGRGRPPIPDLELERGQALGRLGRSSEAAAAFEAEIGAFPDRPEAYAQLAFLYAATGRSEEVSPLLERLVQRNPTAGAYRRAADVFDRLGRPGEGREWRRRAEEATASPPARAASSEGR